MKESIVKKGIAKTKTSEHRHTYFINRVFQGKVTLFIIGILIGYTILLNVFSQLSRSISFSMFFPIVISAIIIFIGLASIFYSHKIAGPLYRLRSVSEKLAAGDLSIRLKFRKGDDPILHEVADHLNKMLNDIQKEREETLSRLKTLKPEKQEGLNL